MRVAVRKSHLRPKSPPPRGGNRSKTKSEKTNPNPGHPGGLGELPNQNKPPSSLNSPHSILPSPKIQFEQTNPPAVSLSNGSQPGPTPFYRSSLIIHTFTPPPLLLLYFPLAPPYN